ncbi:MAG: 50S ribosomal protein L19e [Nanoarchaeota archaeon]
MNNKKNLAAKILKVSSKKVRFAAEAAEEVQKAITKSDMRGLIAVGKVYVVSHNEHSRAGARRIATQKRKGRRHGKGSRKGTKNSVVTRKDKWVSKIRAQRDLLKELRDKALVSTENYRALYAKSKGGYFRNRRHIKLYLKEHHLVEEKK